MTIEQGDEFTIITRFKKKVKQVYIELHVKLFTIKLYSFISYEFSIDMIPHKNSFQTSQNQPNLGHILSKSMPGDKKHLKLSDFSILENAGSVKTVAGNFYSATYDCDTNNDKEGDGEMGTRLFLSKSNKLPVTLLISSKDQSMGHSKNQFSLSAALSFQDNASSITNNGTIMSDSNGKYKLRKKYYIFILKYFFKFIRFFW